MTDLTAPGSSFPSSSHDRSNRSSPSFALLLRRTEHVLSQQVAARISPALESYDLTIERWRVVAALAIEPAQTMTQLAESAVLPPASLTRHIDRLVARGLVSRGASPEDRRRVVASLTREGEAAWEHVHATECEVQNQLSIALGEQRFADFTANLTAVPELLATP